MSELTPNDALKFGIVDAEGGARHEGMYGAHGAVRTCDGAVDLRISIGNRAVSDRDGGIERLDRDVASERCTLKVRGAEDVVRSDAVKLDVGAGEKVVLGGAADRDRGSGPDDFVILATREGELAVGIIAVDVVGRQGRSSEGGKSPEKGKRKSFLVQSTMSKTTYRGGEHEITPFDCVAMYLC